MIATLEKLYEAFDGIPIIDTHSHLALAENQYDCNQDFLENLVSQYLQDDLRSAGMTPSEFSFVMDKTQPLLERFPVFERYWKRTYNTGYARLLRETLQENYGVIQLSTDNIEELAVQYRHNMETPGFYYRILREKCHIRKLVSDHSNYDGISCSFDLELFAPVVRLDHLVMPFSTADLKRIEQDCGFPINSFDDMVDAVPAILERALEHGAIGLKSGLAYNRSLYYSFPDYNEARRGFEGIRDARISLYEDIAYPFVTTTAYQDFMMHEILRQANRRGMVFQFHTGIQVGQGNCQNHINPLLLNHLFIEYRNIKFDIFHAGYPYFYELGSLAKQFPNVYANLCWTHAISPQDARTAFRSWLSAVPVCKILGFGNDVHGIEAVAGHLKIARDNLCRVLASEIEEGLRSHEECVEILHRILYDNPAELYGFPQLTKYLDGQKGG